MPVRPRGDRQSCHRGSRLHARRSWGCNRHAARRHHGGVTRDRAARGPSAPLPGLSRRGGDTSPVITDVEPTSEDLDKVVGSLETSWTATITVRRQSQEDVGYREIYVSLDDALLTILQHGDAITREIAPGAHRLQANNTLFWKTLDVTLGVGEHASFTAVNRAGFGTYSVLAFFFGFLGAGPFYLTFEREGLGTHGP